jgi:phage terminase large subunit-like protein
MAMTKLNHKRFHRLVTKRQTGEEYLEPPKFHDEILDIFSNDDRLQLLVAPVGFAKSTVIKSFGIAESLIKERFILYVGSNYTKVEKQFTGVKKIIEDPVIKAIFNYEIITNNATNIIIQINGVNHAITGVSGNADISGINFENERPGLILIDDLEELEQARSIYRTEQLIEWLKTTLISRLPSLVKGKIRMIGTNLTKNSIVNRILSGQIQGWKSYKYTALREGKSIWEERHPTTALLEEQRINPFEFASNYMNEPLDTVSGLLKYEDLRFYNTLPKIKEAYTHADTTHTGKQTSDYFAIGTVGLGEDNNFYIIDFHLEKMTPEKQALYCIQYDDRMSDYNVKRISYDEVSNASFGYYAKLKAKEMGISLPLEGKKYPRDKVSHLNEHIDKFKSNRVIFPQNHPQLQLALDQLLAFPQVGVHDDFVDFLTGALDGFHKPKTSYGVPLSSSGIVRL